MGQKSHRIHSRDLFETLSSDETKRERQRQSKPKISLIICFGEVGERSMKEK